MADIDDAILAAKTAAKGAEKADKQRIRANEDSEKAKEQSKEFLRQRDALHAECGRHILRAQALHKESQINMAWSRWAPMELGMSLATIKRRVQDAKNATAADARREQQNERDRGSRNVDREPKQGQATESVVPETYDPGPDFEPVSQTVIHTWVEQWRAWPRPVQKQASAIIFQLWENLRREPVPTVTQPIAPPTGFPKVEVAPPRSEPTPRAPKGQAPVCNKPSGVCGYGQCGARGVCLHKAVA